MNKEEIKEKVFSAIEKVICVDKSEIEEQSKIIDDLGADSLDSVELIMECEKECKIAIPDDLSEKVSTVGDLINLIEKRVEEQDQD